MTTRKWHCTIRTRTKKSRSKNARDDQRDAFGALQNGGGPALLPVWHLDVLVRDPLVELGRALGGAADDEPNFAPEDFETWFSKIDGEGLDERLDVLAEHENDLAQLVLAPRKGTRCPSAERLLQSIVCLWGDGAVATSASLNDEMRGPGRKRTSLMSSKELVLNSGMFGLFRGLSGVGWQREKSE
jgi:hypothetical protein